jgi:lysophospholipase L1-like esterase
VPQLALGLVLGLITLEVGLRLARPHHEGLKALLYLPTVATEYEAIASTRELLESSLMGYHPLEPSEGFIHNSRGFRTPEYDPRRAPGTRRIVVLGDSFTYSSGGVPWSQLWPTELGHRLAEAGGGPVEIINLGTPAVGPRFELRLWELEGERLTPDLVILGFFVGNDFTDEAGVPLSPSAEGFLVRHGLVFRLARNLVRLRAAGVSPVAAAPEPPASPLAGGFELPGARESYDPEQGFFADRDAYLRTERERVMLCARSHRAQFERLLAAVTPVLVRLHRQVRASGSDLVVLIIPDEFQVAPELLAEVLTRFDIPPSEIDLDLPQRRLAEVLHREGIRFYDALPALAEETRERRLYEPQDTHWNAVGNGFVAERLADYLGALGWPRERR